MKFGATKIKVVTMLSFPTTFVYFGHEGGEKKLLTKCELDQVGWSWLVGGYIVLKSDFSQIWKWATNFNFTTKIWCLSCLFVVVLLWRNNNAKSIFHVKLATNFVHLTRRNTICLFSTPLLQVWNQTRRNYLLGREFGLFSQYILTSIIINHWMYLVGGKKLKVPHISRKRQEKTSKELKNFVEQHSTSLPKVWVTTLFYGLFKMTWYKFRTNCFHVGSFVRSLWSNKMSPTTNMNLSEPSLLLLL